MVANGDSTVLMSQRDRADRVLGSLYGLAFGDAMGLPTEHRDDPRRVVTRAAATRGDSDSIACIAGALAGAYLGVAAWPQDWIDRIECSERIDRLARSLG
jgi:ADP-ribosylglycohydrolase